MTTSSATLSGAYADDPDRRERRHQAVAAFETRLTMAKTGNTHLRAAAYRMAVVGLQHNPILRAPYARKRAAGKSAMKSLGHSMSKALAIVWAMWRGGTDSDPTHASAGTT